MTRAEALEHAIQAKWILLDMGWLSAAYTFEEVEIFLGATSDEVMSKELCRKRAEFIIPPGRRGHVHLVLSPPPVARASAFAVGLLRSVEF